MAAVQETRLKKVCGVMEERGVDYLLLGPSPALYYLTGIKTVPDERLQLAVIRPGGKSSLIFPEMYREELNKIDFEGELFCWDDKEAPEKLAAQALRLQTDEKKDERDKSDKKNTSDKSNKIDKRIRGDKGKGIAAVDDLLPFRHFQMIKDLLEGRPLLLASEVLKGVRMYKDGEEVSYMREAAAVADRVMEEMGAFIKPGLTEREIAFEVEFRLKKYGGEGLSFTPIVSAGPNGALPHHSPGSYRVKRGDFVYLDFGCAFNGYCSDITRTFCLGEPEREMREVYQLVKEAQETAVKAVKPGKECAEIDRAAREVIEAAGYGQYFTHRTGHGIGLEVHEPPYIVEGNSTILEPGMAFSVEPGVYLPDRFGVRIEDIVVVTPGGCEVLNKADKGLLII